ncbi:MAG: tandem-95 repeat protein, partial [Planctomycetes bacterium]|nr:tandem-95 repeat protein [Planctomycetota bacterium]
MRKAKREFKLESLEKRELMATDFHPSVMSALGTMLFKDMASYQATGQRLEAARLAAGGESSSGSQMDSGSGENGAPLNTVEAEPNNTRFVANLLPLGNGPGKNPVVNVSGQMQNAWDEDYFAFDLKKGDILDIRAIAPGTVQPSLILFNSQGGELLFQKGLFYPPAFGRPIPDKSPRFATGSTTLSYIVDTDGRYFLAVNDAGLAYQLSLRTYRPTIEQEPIGTKQKIYLDFDGSFFRNDVFGLGQLANPVRPSQTVRVAPFANVLPQLGLAATDEPALIRNISNRVEQKLRFQLARDSNNGFYGQTGVPGDFDIEITNSLDGQDIWGQPNVSRVMIGGSLADFGIPAATGLLGIAEMIDIGNFNRENQALVMLDLAVGVSQAIVASGLAAGNVPLADIFAQFLADVISHEVGHYMGAMHQDPSSSVITLMDPAYNPLAIAGRDGRLGTPDDEPLRFLNDAYRPGETFAGGGVNNSANIVAFGASTGKIGGSITGISYNDRNRNGRQDSGEEGISGWEVFADLNNNGTRELGEPRATTGANGSYALLVAPGTYTVRLNRAPSWIASLNSELAKSVVVSTAGAVANFGSVLPSNIATGFKWLDLNADGIRDNGEPALAGVYMYLDLDGDERPDIGEPASITAADGSYSLTPPRAGTYAIREVVEAGYIQTFPASGKHLVTYDGVNPLRGFDFGNAESSDWGDAPAPYLTTRAQGGASHGATPGLRLGSNWDSEQSGQPSVNADGDDANGIVSTGGVIDDEDGVLLLTPIVRGDNSNVIQVVVTNTAGSPAYVQGWIDFNGDGDWSDAGEQIVTNLMVTSSGANNVTFTTPANAVSRTYARFRLSQQQGLGPAGRSSTGEVEDYVFNIVDGPRTLLQPDNFSVARNSRDNVLDVVANDFALPGEAWTITGVSAGSRGGRVTIDTATNRVRYTPALSFIGVDEFTYTARSTSGRVESARVTINVVAQFLDPVAVDDSFDVPTNSIGFPLSVLANDIEGRGGALIVTSVTNPSRGGSVTIGSGGQSIRYTPRRDFGGTETFSYTATDGTGKSTTANITVHTLPGDRLDDLVEFSFQFFNLSGERITEIRQGEQFRVSVFVDDLRPERAASQNPPGVVVDPGVFSAYLDVLYSSGLVAPASPTSTGGLDFNVQFSAPYLSGRNGTAQTPGIIDEFGAFVGNISAMNEPNPLKIADLLFTATNPGLAEFVGDPADLVPQSDVTFYNTTRAAVPKEEIRYGRSLIEIVPSGVNFPYAMDDSPARLPAGVASVINVLANDIPGTQPPIRISSTTQPANGQVQISDNNTPSNFADDRIIYTPNTNFFGTDEFKYTITDSRGFTSTATVTLQVGTEAQVQADDLVQLRLAVTNLQGQEISQVNAGSKFQLRGYAKDLRTNPTAAGVFAAFQDVQFPTSLVSVDAKSTAPFFQVVYGADYLNATSGDTRIPGLINELGSAQTGNSPLGLDEKLQFIITFTATRVGVANFIGDPADIKPFHDTLLFNPTTPLLNSQIRFITDAVSIVGSSSGGSGAGEGNTNLVNAYDVNNDGFISPIDALILVNALNSGGAGPLANDGPLGSGESLEKLYLDVNADNFLSPLDALAVINELNSSTSKQ